MERIAKNIREIMKNQEILLQREDTLEEMNVFRMFSSLIMRTTTYLLIRSKNHKYLNTKSANFFYNKQIKCV